MVAMATSLSTAGPPSNTILWAHRSPQPKRHLDRFGRFCTDARNLQWGTPSPSKLPLPMGDLDSHLIHGSLGPPESPAQTASRSVQSFFAGLTSVTDRQTDRSGYSVGNNRPHLRT